MATAKGTVKVILLVNSRRKSDGKLFQVGNEIELTEYAASILVSKGHAELVEGELPEKPVPKPVRKVAGTEPAPKKEVGK
jgi:hypothetical protein